MGGLSRRASKRALMCLAVFGVGGIAGLVAGFGADPGADASEAGGLSPAEIVAMRFPAATPAADESPDGVTAPSEPIAYVLASADDRGLASLIFDPNPAYPLARPPAAAASAPSPASSRPNAVAGGAMHAGSVSPPSPAIVELPPQLANAEPELPAAALAYAPAEPTARPLPAAPPQGANAATPTVKKPPRPASVSSAVLNSAQIASIKERLKLTSYQNTLWPPVESALRDISYQSGHDAARKSAAEARGGTIDPNSAPVQRLKSAAFPLLMSLNEEQKQEVRTMVRLMGLENLASMF